MGETLAALGLAVRVVARDETSDVPAIASAPIVTKAHATSAELVLAQDPDLVLVDAATSPPEAIDQIRSTGVTVVEVPEAWSVTDMGPGPAPSPMRWDFRPRRPIRSSQRPPAA